MEILIYSQVHLLCYQHSDFKFSDILFLMMNYGVTSISTENLLFSITALITSSLTLNRLCMCSNENDISIIALGVVDGYRQSTLYVDVSKFDLQLSHFLV